jgi:hypothetical protein
MVSVFSTIVFLASYEAIQSVFANPQGTMKDQMKNMMGMQNQSMMMDQSQKQAIMKQMNKTEMMDQSQKQAIMKQMNKTEMMDQSQKQAMMKQMNKTGMMMGKTNK